MTEELEPGLEEELPEEELDDEMRPVASTMVAEIGFNRESEELEVVFNNGRQDSYPCSPLQWEEVKSAPSVGKFMWEVFF